MNNLITQPFYEIYKGKTPITEKVERFSYDNSKEKDNFLSITIISDFRYNPLQTEAFREGEELSFRFGLLGENAKQSPLHSCKITSIKYEYGERVTIQIKAMDKGNSMKKTIGLKAYDEKLVKEIVKEIAINNGLEPKIETGAGEFTAGAIVQGGRSDFAFLQYLCSLEPSGNYTIFVQDNELRYEKIGYDKTAKKTYYIFGDSKNVVSFESEYSDSEKGQNQNIKSVATNDKITVTKEITPNNDTSTTLGKNKVVSSLLFDKNADEIGKNIITPTEPINQNAGTNQPPKTSTVASQQQKATQKILKGRLRIELEPNIFPNEVITIAGGFERDNGNWLVLSCNHSGSFTSLELTKNGTNRKGKNGISNGNDVVKSEKVNNSIGNSGKEEKRYIYNRNADSIGK